ncbi:bifunctional phosphopantothenoylcysteine decarboxylase/phosphopantothenate--cysteine ligase CoaBC [Ligilactobacillus sp. WILCCON 0076]|uniref:Coenzyme A biosynthesis bifunctional protein CoaBC n=1 Tax=Ligilactobacillus ubinensis TaxID=2876789 RepID=A0A9X2FLN9_9LACO|nr:bifunctional phosphopantothenoylcysteine decarboxylase/phosphopantothenate--cysteine ligase CoaBC [Ligilactobacillus ubinensis]MCP0887001.1 bifunctional phosphopantothenoylcysteine decarboxylase/phosphopantothenate--cysteine ligase CoaBC [Ligilactobacillus ubinensis]
MEQKRIAVYITGGIATYKAVSLVRLLIKNGMLVRVAMTKGAQKFVTPLTFATLTKHDVYTDVFNVNDNEFVPHIALADWSDIALVVPATANIVAKMTHGIADDIVSTALLATDTPKFVVPAMNEKMLLNKATIRNLKQLVADGVHILEPATGFLAEGYSGKGRMPEPEEIYEWLQASFKIQQDFLNKNIVITAGGTQENLDPVRYLTNRSSGKMGYALAKVAQKRGANVTLISGVTKLSPPVGIEVKKVITTADMATTVKIAFEKADIMIMAAAVSDYRVANPAKQKVKKDNDHWLVDLVKNEDILKSLGKLKGKQILVGFAAETENLIANASKKMLAKNLDLLVANDVSRNDIGFGTDENEVTLLQPNQDAIQLKRANKDKIADKILDTILKIKN